MPKSTKSSIQPPLADQLRPTKLDDIVGQHQLLDPGRPLRQLIEQKKPLSYIFYGPAGIGKTTLARVIAHELNLPMENFNAAIDTKTKLKTILKKYPKQPVAIVLDEIHRLTKPLQDFLLPYLENGHIRLLGCTTENPMITIAPAIRSRCALFPLTPVSEQDIATNLTRVSHLTWPNDPKLNPKIAKDIASASNGDVRTSINLLETLHTMHGAHITHDDVKQYAGKRHFTFDKDSTYHYDTISALQKSVRGADTDAALYYAAVMCESGDLETLIRRLKIMTYEDIGLGDPVRAQQAATALLIANNLGLPEARIPIANAIILLTTANHSNSAYVAMNKAIEDAKDNNQHPIPYHLRDTHYKHANQLGHQGYIYPHDYPHDWYPQQYLPKDLLTRTYFSPHDNASENPMKKRYQGLKTAQLEYLKKHPDKID